MLVGLLFVRSRDLVQQRCPPRLETLMRSLIMLAFALVLPAQAEAQALAETPAARLTSVTAGFGNSMGWLGLQGERYLRSDRFSVFGGIGYVPASDPGDSSGAAFAGGIRAFTGGTRHRGFLEFSVSQLTTHLACFEECHDHYGPGVQAGYQYVSRRGLTALASVGVGYAPGIPDGETKVGGIGGLGLGYTWRR